MKLVKTGPAKLTLNNSNNYTGGTVVSGGALFVNGVVSSAVTVERRRTPEGPSQFGGVGQLGNNLTIQAGCILTVGANTNSPARSPSRIRSPNFGSVLNQFDLSSDPAGVTSSNDVLQVFGNVVLSGTNTIEIKQTAGFSAAEFIH